MFPNSQAHLARTCVTYMSFHSFQTGTCTTFPKFDNRKLENSLYYYSVKNWGHHTRLAEIDGEPLITSFLKNEGNVAVSSQAMDWDLYGREKITGGHLAAYFGLQRAMEVLLDEKESYLIDKDSEGWTPLFYAVQSNNEGMVNLLLANDRADVNCKDYKAWTPLLYAVSNGKTRMVELLLAYDRVDPNCRDDEGWTPLIIAINGKNAAIVESLIARRVEVNYNFTLVRNPIQKHEILGNVLLITDDGGL